MSREPELSAAYARLILQSEVATPAQLLAGTGLTLTEVTEREFLDAASLAIIFSNYNNYASDSAWTARLGALFNIAAHGALGFAALSAPTLGEAMDVMGVFHPSRNTVTRAETYANDTQYVFALQDHSGDRQFGRLLAEVILKIVESLVATIVGHPVGKNVVISFRHPVGKELIAAYDATVLPDTDADSLAVPLSWRRLPSPLYDESIYRSNLIKCRELIARREQSGSMVFAVRNILSNYFDNQTLGEQLSASPPSLNRVAEQLHLTPRTLMRRLNAEDTAFKTILEALRREHAQSLLADARLTVAEVGEILGYGDQANFGRAFKRWFGVSPASWRRQRPQ
jgi:AraC-like DNA-binding protein